MFEKPFLCTTDAKAHVYVPMDELEKLVEALGGACLRATRIESTFGFENLNAGTRTEMARVEMDADVDRDDLRSFLRRWTG